MTVVIDTYDVFLKFALNLPQELSPGRDGFCLLFFIFIFRVEESCGIHRIEVYFGFWGDIFSLLFFLWVL